MGLEFITTFFDTRVEQTSRYIVDNESQVSHLRERSHESGEGKARGKPLAPYWDQRYPCGFMCR